MELSRIESSFFTNLSPNSALQIKSGNFDIEIINSAFTQCCNEETSGGAISITDWEHKIYIVRCCGDECHTIGYENANDFGQFFFIKSSSSSCVASIESTTALKCPAKQISPKHNGPFGFEGSSTFSTSNSNCTNNQCRLGPGVASYKTSNLIVSFMNFANDLTDNKDATLNGGYMQFWIATAFYEGTGSVKSSNFVECKSLNKGSEKPPGIYTLCYFLRCTNYAEGTLGVGSTIKDMNDFSFPLTCAIKILGTCCNKIFIRFNCLEVFTLTTILFFFKN